MKTPLVAKNTQPDSAAPKGRHVNNPVQVQRSGTQLGDAIRPFLHSRGAQVFRYAPAVRRAKSSGVAFTPRLRTGLFTGSPCGALRIEN